MHGAVARGLLLCLVCLGLSAGRAQAAPGWAPLTPIGSGLTGLGITMDVDLTPTGAATVAWRGTSEGHEAILVASGPAGRAFTAPVVVSRGNGEVGRPSIDVAPSGVAVVTWAQKDAGGSWVVQAAVRSSAGQWQAPDPLSAPKNGPPDPQVAIADDGAAIALWVGNDTAAERGIESSRREAGGGWTPAQNVSNYYGDQARLVMDRQGNATALWVQDNSDIVMTAERPAGGAWSTPPQPRSEAGARTPYLAVGADGGVAAIWQRGTDVEAAIRPRGAAWGAAEPIGSPAGIWLYEMPQIALDGHGTATAVINGESFGARRHTRPAGGPWGTGQPLASPSYTPLVEWPAVAANASGFTLIGYFGRKDPNPFGGGGIPIVHGATRQPGAAWTNPLGLTEVGGVTAVDVDDAGNGLVCWMSHTGAVFCRTYDATAPQLLDLAIPATGVAERALTFGVRPVDSWSALGTTSWSFGDGTSATGTRPTHTYAAAGSYTVRATARDALGNASAVQRVVNVAPAPPEVAIADVAFRRAAFRRSSLNDKARVLVKGTMSAPLRVSFRLTGPLRPRADRRTVVLGTRNLDAGAFSERVDIPDAVAARMLPGRYELELTGPGLIPDADRVRLRAPEHGVVMAHRISTTRNGQNLLRVTSAKRLWATFTFAPGAGTDQKLRAVWYAPNSDEPVGSFPVKRAFSWWGNPSGLAKGRWRCVLVARGHVVDSVSIRVG